MTSKIKISHWDTAKFLKSQADIDDYLEVAFATGDSKQIARAIGNAARAKGMIDIARQTGLARENLYRTFNDNGNPTLHTLTQVIDVLGYRLALTPKQSPPA